MGSLAPYLTRSMEAHLPAGWAGTAEARVFTPRQASEFGFQGACDLLLENQQECRKVWIEFEISRSDPVANQVKYAVRHVVSPYSAKESFISMGSTHLAPGRKLLLQANVHVLRRLGMRAFHLPLLPHLDGPEIQRLNQLDQGLLDRENLPVKKDVERLLAVIEPIASRGGIDAHYIGDLSEALLNVRRWNEQMTLEKNQRKWGKRTVTFFATDPTEKLFAPSKFCAYQISGDTDKKQDNELPGAINISNYVRLGEQNPKFDGRLARLHLEKRLGMQLLEKGSLEETTIHKIFKNWLPKQEKYIRLHPKGPKFLVPKDYPVQG
jgi:hypothetical protein